MRPLLTSDIVHRDEFRAFCIRLGEVFAAEDYTVIRVASDRRITADRWIVEGFANAIGPPIAGRVEVYPRKNKYPFANLEKSKPSLIVRPSVPDARKAVSAHLRMLQDADAALLIGGKDGVLNAGLAAILTRARVWAVGYFGGGARQFLDAASTFDGTIARLPDRRLAARLNSRESALAAIEEEAKDFPRIMIVHGRSGDRKEVADILAAAGVRRKDVLVDQSAPGAVIIEEFERYAALSDAAIAILTPDDLAVATLTPDGQQPDVLDVALPRARQNVLLEYGWFWSRLGRERTLLLVKEPVEVPSDLYGVKVVRYTDHPVTCRNEIDKFVASIRRGHIS
jgi:predicted nucleotide-binding protein